MARKFVPPQSLRFVPEEVPSFVKARTHHRKADSEGKPHQAYLQRWRGFELLYRDVAPLTRKHDAFVFARDASEIDVIGACLGQLSRPRVDLILGSADVGELNVHVSRHAPERLVGANLLLQQLGVTVQVWLDARKDLRFALKANTYRGLKAVGTLLLIVRAASDPQVKKDDHMIADLEGLAAANRLLKDCVAHLIEHFQRQHDEFFEPGFRANLRKV